jgi:hypothetical protein
MQLLHVPYVNVFVAFRLPAFVRAIWSTAPFSFRRCVNVDSIVTM